MVEHTRTLDFKIAFALGLGTMIAAGIFSLSGTAVAQIGSTAVVAFVLAAVVAGITAATYSEFASIYSENGGGYLFTARTFEERDVLTYAIGMSLFLGYTGTTAFYLATMDEWFFMFIVPSSFHVLPHGTFGVLAAVVLGVLNARGTEESGTFQLLVTSAKVGVLLLFIAGMFVTVGPGTATAEFTGGFQFEPVNTVSIAALAFITFFGFSAIAASAGEIIRPRETVPKAIAASIVTVTVLYAFVIVAMVNVFNVADRLARDPETVLQLGETAMGAVAQAYIPLTIGGVQVGTALIVAGAIFSMVSASNASILAASGIGSLMGRQGHAPRPFSRLHPEHGTPFWSVTTATATIVALIVAFMTLLGEGGVVGAVALPGLPFEVELGLNALTGFATFNLLVPLAVVNAVLIYSRRRFPDVERGFRVPLVPWLPVVGIVANLALIYNLPEVGVYAGIAATLALLGAYLVWGGEPQVEELFERVVEPSAPPATEDGAGGDRYRVLVPIARLDTAVPQVRLAARLASLREGEAFVQVLTVTPIPEQTPSEIVMDEAREDTERLEAFLENVDVDVDYSVEGHVCRNVAFDILQTARDDGADLVLMGYPEANPDVAEAVEYRAPCDVAYASGVDPTEAFERINVGAGGGPHHGALLPMVDAFGAAGADVHVISVDPEGSGTGEDPGETVSALTRSEAVQVHNVTGGTVAEGLVSTAAENGGLLLIGASRDRRLRQWVFGSTPDRVVTLAEGADVPVVVYAGRQGMPQRVEDYLFPVYRYARGLVSRWRGGRAASQG